MMRIAWVLIAATTACGLIGCGSDYDAMQFIHPDTTRGKVLLSLESSSDQLKQEGRISESRMFNMLDGTAISAWRIAARGKDAPLGTVVLLHGLGESKVIYLDVGNKLADKGYDVVLVDLRTHGHSGGAYVTHGIYEKFDVKAVVTSLLTAGTIHEPIYAAGVTLGAVTALQYAAIDPRCRGVMAIDAYADLRGYADYSMRLTPQANRDAAMERIERATGIRVGEASSLKAIASLHCPVLLAASVLDLSIPASNSQALFEAAHEPKELIAVEPLSLALTWRDWMADQIDRLARTGLKKTAD